MHVHIYMCMCVCVYVCMCLYVCVCVCMCVCVCVRKMCFRCWGAIGIQRILFNLIYPDISHDITRNELILMNVLATAFLLSEASPLFYSIQFYSILFSSLLFFFFLFYSILFYSFYFILYYSILFFYFYFILSILFYSTKCIHQTITEATFIERLISVIIMV